MARPATKALPESGGPRKFLIHGNPGTGKSPLAMRLPWGPVWGEKAVLLAVDQKEVNLPCAPDRYIIPDYAGASDPYSFVKSVLEYDWRSEGAGTVIIDTATTLARDYMKAAINSGGYNTKAVNFGKEILKLADKPHYGLVHNLMAKTLEAIKRCPLNVVCVFWSDYLEPEGGQGAFGGPLSVNMNGSRAIAGEFSNIIYTRTESAGGKTQYLAHTENCGIWVARLAGVQPNPIPVIKMETDPVNVWKEIDRVQGYGA